MRPKQTRQHGKSWYVTVERPGNEPSLRSNASFCILLIYLFLSRQGQQQQQTRTNITSSAPMTMAWAMDASNGRYYFTDASDCCYDHRRDGRYGSNGLQMIGKQRTTRPPTAIVNGRKQRTPLIYGSKRLPRIIDGMDDTEATANRRQGSNGRQYLQQQLSTAASNVRY